MFSALRLQLLQIGIPATVAEAKYELMLLLRQRGATPDVTAPGVGSPYSPPRQTTQSRIGRTASGPSAARSPDSLSGVTRVPPHAYFLVSAVFHYLGPAFAVMLFAQVAVLGVAWLRIASAALVFAAWRRPWRMFLAAGGSERLLLVALGAVLAAMNTCFYLAIDRLPLSTVGAIEFVGPIALAAVGVRSVRNLLALTTAGSGVYLLTDVRLAAEPLGFVFAFANCALFALYVLLGHRAANTGGGSGVDRLGAAMIVAMVVAAPIGLQDATAAFADPVLLLAGVGVGLSSSVIPYVCDQLAMARLARPTFALLLSLLPATATVIGLVVLAQVPSRPEVAGIALVVAGVALHRERVAR
jgi:inner membrane transporter RhtA